MPPENKEIAGGYIASELDDLIPEELRLAVEKQEASTKKVKEETLDLEEEEYEYEDEEDEEDATSASNTYKSEYEDEDEEDDSDEDLLLGDENIEALLKGDTKAVSKKAQKKAKGLEADEEEPSWYNDEEYKDVIEQVSSYGVDRKTIDKLITKVADKRVLDTNAHLSTVSGELYSLKNSKELMDAEMRRLKEIERSAHFDSSEEVQLRYGKPMTDSILAIKDVLELENLGVTVKDVIDAKDRSSLNRLLEDYEIDEDSRLKINNHWKNYRELSLQYNVDKDDAKKSLQNKLSTSIPENTATKVLRNGLAEMLQSDDRLKYIQEGIDKGIDKVPEASKVIALAKQNFFNMLGVLGAPSEFVHNDKWLGGLAKYMLDSSHNKNIADKYYLEIQEKQNLEKNLAKMVKAYKKLANSAKGITGNKGGVGVSGGNRSSRQTENILEEFNQVLAGKLEF